MAFPGYLALNRAARPCSRLPFCTELSNATQRLQEKKKKKKDTHRKPQATHKNSTATYRSRAAAPASEACSAGFLKTPNPSICSTCEPAAWDSLTSHLQAACRCITLGGRAARRVKRAGFPPLCGASSGSLPCARLSRSPLCVARGSGGRYTKAAAPVLSWPIWLMDLLRPVGSSEALHLPVPPFHPVTPALRRERGGEPRAGAERQQMCSEAC